jgi:hypothetical protein
MELLDAGRRPPKSGHGGRTQSSVDRRDLQPAPGPLARSGSQIPKGGFELTGGVQL